MKAWAEIEAAIKQFPENDIRQLAGWIQNYLNEKWDRQIEEDLAAGKLDALIAKAEADIATNKVRNIDEIIEKS
ncbi:hypothetical protein H6S82_04510 [Planktothrix sp. FACHB-1355]|uniref:Uncharacterized protein n=1 Tax=Aerosakkonema funiforme FACHB-1375 TaxID=2949571 RepID=A0A926VJ29_9CYAN|nr:MULTISPECIES: hypothetical protein [Oscillatoriales]MBD2183612.1 hypothetical protein [Aerosakkonema funiforme FACHB-1375]MBD3558116.1 hypothetical protein [Planktothrix sp. FACHB-1355]